MSAFECTRIVVGLPRGLLVILKLSRSNARSVGRSTRIKDSRASRASENRELDVIAMTVLSETWEGRGLCTECCDRWTQRTQGSSTGSRHNSPFSHRRDGQSPREQQSDGCGCACGTDAQTGTGCCWVSQMYVGSREVAARWWWGDSVSRKGGVCLLRSGATWRCTHARRFTAH